jgi:hypothetical protein
MGDWDVFFISFLSILILDRIQRCPHFSGACVRGKRNRIAFATAQRN